MGCASGKKFSRCSDVKELHARQEPQLISSMSVSPEPHEKDHMGDSKPTLVTSVSPTVTSRPQGASVAPVAELLAASRDPPLKIVKTLPPKKVLGGDAEDEAVVIEAPAKFRHHRKTSMELVAEEARFQPHTSQLATSPSEPILPIVKNISGVKNTFDKGKYKELNPTNSKSVAALPRTIEDKLEEIQLFGAISEMPVAKPLSSLTLPIRSLTSNFTGSGVPVMVRPAPHPPGKSTYEATVSTSVSDYRA